MILLLVETLMLTLVINQWGTSNINSEWTNITRSETNSDGHTQYIKTHLQLAQSTGKSKC